MPQLMPLNWCFSMLVFLLVYVIMIKFYFLKFEKMEKEIEISNIIKNWMW